jgi:hypothetical protein
MQSLVGGRGHDALLQSGYQIVQGFVHLGFLAEQCKHFHIFSTNSKFSQSFTIHYNTIYYNFFTTYSFPPFSLYPFPPSEKAEAVKGKRKKYCSHVMKKRADLSGRFLCRVDRLCEFSAILFTP